MTTELNADFSHAGTRISSSEINFPSPNPLQLVNKDLKEGLQKWRVWLMLAYHDIKLRYRRSFLGPLWITLSMAITAYSMGYLYSQLFHTDIQIYFPYLVAGIISWGLISVTLTDLVDTFSPAESASNTVKQIKLPYSFYIHRLAARNMLIFFHNLIVIIPVLIFFHHTAKVTFNTLFLIPDIIIFYLNAFSIGLILALIGARFRDLAQIIKSLIQVVFFITPIMWHPSVLPANQQIWVKLNPVYALVELLRAPLIGQAPTLQSFVIVFMITLVSAFVAYKMFLHYRARIIYWL